MDIKSMAKSKRSHTRQNQPRKHFPNPSKPSPSGNPNSDKKDGTVRNKEEELSLPSNWDRYRDDDDDEQQGIELPIGSNSESKMKVVSDVVKPKSKGGNLADLIAQARESRSGYSPSFDDTLPDVYQGLGPLLSVKGENLISWGGDDFFADDEATNIQEVPFLSLDLQDLAQQLAKVDLAKRLFIEEDLLPPELRGQEADASDNQTFFQRHGKHEKTRLPETFDELLALYWEEEQNAKQEKDDGKKSSSLQEHSEDIKLHEEPYLATHVTEKYSKPSPEFKGEDAEEELDMLLNSFTETKPFVDIPVTSSLDDALDNLLEETSKEDNKGGLSESTNVKANSFHNPSSSSPSNPISEPKVLDDFDSWFDTI